MNVEPLDEDAVARIVNGVLRGTLAVWWTTGPDLENTTAATIAKALVDNPQDLAGLVMDSDNRMIFGPQPYIHNANKTEIVLRVEEGRSTMLNRGSL